MLAAFAVALLDWYGKHKRDLPWRRHGDPYAIWISEVMLQQTTVQAVIPYFEKWMKQYPAVDDVANASLDDILNLWQGLGYYQRARNIYKAAQVISREFGGVIPRQYDELKRLPGFGPYTTGAVLSIAFGQRVPIVDANVRRVVMRQLALPGVADVSQDGVVYRFLDQVMPEQNMSSFNQGLMELGALVCRSREPICLLCPVRSSCAAYAQGCQEIIPEPKKKIIHKVDAAIAVIEHNEAFYIQRRPDKGLLAGLWEFPGGKVEEGEDVEQALMREVREELNCAVGDMHFFTRVRHFYTQYAVTLHVYWCRVEDPLPEDEAHMWVRADELGDYAMPSGSARIVEKIWERLGVKAS